MLHLTERSRRAALERLHMRGLKMLAELPDRRSFEARLQAETARVRAIGGTVALCLIDVDRLREVNARYGRASGDGVLGALVRNLTDPSRPHSVFRTGGDEFAVIFADLNTSQVRSVMRGVDRSVSADTGCRRIGLSWGVSATAGADAATLMRRAGAELTAVKRTRMRRPAEPRLRAAALAA